MLTPMTDEDLAAALQVFRACVCRGRGDKGRDNHKLLEAAHDFTVHNMSWRVQSAEFCA
jgi:hypothetical protein